MAKPQARISIRQGFHPAKTLTLDPGEYLLGSDPSMPVVLSGAGAGAAAKLTFDGEQVRVEEMGGSSSIYIDGKRVDGAAVLKSDDIVELRGSSLKLRLLQQLEQALDADVPRPSDLPCPPLPDLKPRNFEIREEIARGGMGRVLCAADRNIERTVAMKVIRDDRADSTEHRARFLQEARLTGQLQHPNIIPVHELGVDEQGRLFYTMKHVRGVTLREVIERLQRGDPDAVREFPLARLVTIFLKVCDAVAYAHSRGVIHRDLKPDNIMIGEYGEVLLMDWGLAKILTSRPTSASGHAADTAGPPSCDATRAPAPLESSTALHGLTLDGRILGTLHFMSPEQAEGNIERIDVRSDIYSLGAILYQILTLRPPVDGNNVAEVLRNIRQGNNPPPSGNIPSSLASVARKALARDPADRYQRVTDLQRDIESWQGGFLTSAEPKTALKMLALLMKRRKIESAALLAILGVVTVFTLKIIERTRFAHARTEELGRTAPLYRPHYAETISLIKHQRFEEALDKITYAIALSPDHPGYHLLQGNILQSLLRFPEAAAAYRRVLELEPHHPLARENLALSERLGRQMRDRGGPSESNLAELQTVLRRQGRFDEALALLALMKENPQRLFETWRDVLEASGLVERLTTDEHGRLQLDLSDTEVSDLTLIASMPLVVLNLARSRVTDLSPLARMPLKELRLDGCERLTDLSPLAECPSLERLTLPPHIVNVQPLRNLPSLRQIGASFPEEGWDAVPVAETFWRDQPSP